MLEAVPYHFALNHQPHGKNTDKLPMDPHELPALIAARADFKTQSQNLHL
jgi:hypothetical protein